MLGVRAEKGPPIAGTKEPVTGVLPLATWIEESSHARVLSWPASSSSSSLRVGAAHDESNHIKLLIKNIRIFNSQSKFKRLVNLSSKLIIVV